MMGEAYQAPSACDLIPYPLLLKEKGSDPEKVFQKQSPSPLGEGLG